MKKILYIFDAPTTEAGGAQQSMEIVIDGLKESFKFYTITPNQKKVFENQYILKEYNDFFHISIRQKILLCLKIKNIVKKIQPDIIHVQMPVSFLIIGFLKYFYQIDKSIKLIYTDRGVLNKYSFIFRKAFSLFEKFLNVIIATTEYNKELYRSLAKVDEKKLSIIPNTAGSSYETFNENLVHDYRYKYGFKPTDLVIGFCGRMVEDKNWMLAYQIINELNKNMDFKVCIVLGTDKTEKNILEAKEFLKNVEQIVGKDRLMGIIDMNPKEMPKFYYLSDIFILTSKNESFGRTAVEAMSRKNVVYATKVDGLAEVVLFEEYLYENLDEFMNKFLNLIRHNNEILNREKQKFYERFKSTYDLKTNLQLHYNLYKNL